MVVTPACVVWRQWHSLTDRKLSCGVGKVEDPEIFTRSDQDGQD